MIVIAIEPNRLTKTPVIFRPGTIDRLTINATYYINNLARRAVQATHIHIPVRKQGGI